MNFKGYAEVATTLPDDIVEENDEIITYPGRNVIEAVSEILRASGYDLRPAGYRHERGWDVNVYVRGKRIWLGLQGIDPKEFILLTEAKVGFFTRLFGVDLIYYAEFLTDLNDGLQRDPRFSKVEWYELRNQIPVGEAADAPLKVMDWRG